MNMEGNVILLGAAFQETKLKYSGLIIGRSRFFCTSPPAWHGACWKILQKSQQILIPFDANFGGADTKN